MRLAIIDKEKCKPHACSQECKKFCPINRKGEECVIIDGKAKIDEKLCIGCGICQQRCPFDAIEIINLPEIDASKLVHRYGANG
ncbi:MAG: 4Fe-4S binding protein, partial [Candidatus Nanoarchaeia archaeon]